MPLTIGEEEIEQGKEDDVADGESRESAASITGSVAPQANLNRIGDFPSETYRTESIQVDDGDDGHGEIQGDEDERGEAIGEEKLATEVCEADIRSEECRVAWDEVEEVSQAKADLMIKLKLLNQDPLESFCQENLETDECRIYED